MWPEIKMMLLSGQASSHTHSHTNTCTRRSGFQPFFWSTIFTRNIHSHRPDSKCARNCCIMNSFRPKKKENSEIIPRNGKTIFSDDAVGGEWEWSVMNIIIVLDSVWSVTRAFFSTLSAAFNHGAGQLTGCLAATAALGYMLDGLNGVGWKQKKRMRRNPCSYCPGDNPSNLQIQFFDLIISFSST